MRKYDSRLFLRFLHNPAKVFCCKLPGPYFDELSLRNNREVALTVRGPDLIRQIDEGLFLKDMAASEELRALLPWPEGWWLLEATSVWY